MVVAVLELNYSSWQLIIQLSVFNAHGLKKLHCKSKCLGYVTYFERVKGFRLFLQCIL